MKTNEQYMSLLSDMSGSISKNRFRIEVLWGISKMFDMYKEYEDFTVVFDNVCDIEIHLQEGQEYYQIKSNKIASPKPISYYLRKPKNSNSIFGKLVILNDKKYNTLKVALVSNAYLCDGNKTFTEYEELLLDCLEDKYKKKINDKLLSEFGTIMNINNFYYIHTSMNLENPENDLLGKTIITFESIKKCEPQKPNALFRLIIETAQKKAQYEFKSKDYTELISKKGFSKSELDDMLNTYADTIDNSIEQVQKIIDKVDSISIKKKLNFALTSLIKNIDNSHQLKQIELKICNLLNGEVNFPDSFDALVEYLIELFLTDFSLEFDEYEIRVFIMIVIKRWENNYYEKVGI